ncbi:MAG: hypothetical protein RIQ72_468 [Candidatus Parcubacteria bacterium]|jgi:hypothetical protein
MKTRIVRIVLALFLIGHVFAAQIESAVIRKIINMKFKDFFTKEVVIEMVRRANKQTSDYERPNWNYSYRVLREVAFKESFGLEEGVAKGKPEGHPECYENLRTLFLARAKEELHRGKTNILVTLYQEHHDTIMAALRELPAKDLPKVAQMITSAKEVFTAMKRQNPKELLHIALVGVGFSDSTDHLSRNLTAEETWKEIQKLMMKDAEPKDPALVKFAEKRHEVQLVLFAYRRHLEGGSKLLDKYLAFIEVMEKDIAKLSAGN